MEGGHKAVKQPLCSSVCLSHLLGGCKVYPHHTAIGRGHRYVIPVENKSVQFMHCFIWLLFHQKVSTVFLHMCGFWIF